MLALRQSENKPSLKRKFGETQPSATDRMAASASSSVSTASAAASSSLHGQGQGRGAFSAVTAAAGVASELGNVLDKGLLQSFAVVATTPGSSLGVFKSAASSLTEKSGPTVIPFHDDSRPAKQEMIEEQQQQQSPVKKQKIRSLSWAPEAALCKVKVYHVVPEEKVNPELMLITGPENRNPLAPEHAWVANKNDVERVLASGESQVPALETIGSLDEILTRIDTSLLYKINPVDISKALNTVSSSPVPESLEAASHGRALEISATLVPPAASTSVPVSSLLPPQSQPQISIPQFVTTVQQLIIANIASIPSEKMGQILESLKNLQMTADIHGLEKVQAPAIPAVRKPVDSLAQTKTRRRRWGIEPSKRGVYERVDEHVPAVAASIY